MKRRPRFPRRVIRRLVAVVTAGSLAACEAGTDETPSNGAGTPPPEIMAGAYRVAQGVLYRVDADSQVALLALPGAGAARDTLALEPDTAGALGLPRFRRMSVSPDSKWVAWEATGAGSWVGVASDGTRRFRVLGRWTRALPDSLIWAPTGRYLAVRLRHPDGHHRLSLYDVEAGRRLPLPWDDQCDLERPCDVTRVEWLGGTLLDVELRPGPDEPSVPFEVNVEELTAAPGPNGEEVEL